MSLWSRLFTACVLGHDEPIKVLRRKIVKGKPILVMSFECPRCHQDLGVVLPHQKLKTRKDPKPLTLVRLRKQA